MESFYSKTELEPGVEFMKPEASVVGDIMTESQGLINNTINSLSDCDGWQQKSLRLNILTLRNFL